MAVCVLCERREASKRRVYCVTCGNRVKKRRWREKRRALGFEDDRMVVSLEWDNVGREVDRKAYRDWLESEGDEFDSF